jgi:hypothetical protein
VAQHEERFEIDGVVYESLADVPQPFRDSIAALMADHDGNGTPDVFDRPSGSNTVVHRTESYEVDGVTYSSLDDIPEPQRDVVREALGRQASMHSPAAPVEVPSSPAPPATSPATTSARPIVERAGWSRRTRVVVTMIAIDVGVAALVLWLVLR